MWLMRKRRPWFFHNKEDDWVVFDLNEIALASYKDGKITAYHGKWQANVSMDCNPDEARKFIRALGAGKYLKSPEPEGMELPNDG